MCLPVYIHTYVCEFMCVIVSEDAMVLVECLVQGSIILKKCVKCEKYERVLSTCFIAVSE